MTQMQHILDSCLTDNRASNSKRKNRSNDKLASSLEQENLIALWPQRGHSNITSRSGGGRVF